MLRPLILLFLGACATPPMHPPEPASAPAPVTSTPAGVAPPPVDAAATPGPEAASALPQGCHPELVEVSGSSASDLNTLGLRCHKLGELSPAAAFFRAAIQVDPKLALAHYNLACALALLRVTGEICDEGAYLSSILDELEQAVALDEGRRARAREDADLESIHPTVRFQVLMGSDLTQDAEISRVLQLMPFWGPGAGLIGNDTRLVFSPQGKVSYDHGALTDEGGIQWTPTRGRWSVNGGRIQVDAGGESWALRLSPTGELQDHGQLRFTDAHSECEA